jgi:hypothetical protein
LAALAAVAVAAATTAGRRRSKRAVWWPPYTTVSSSASIARSMCDRSGLAHEYSACSADMAACNNERSESGTE